LKTKALKALLLYFFWCVISQFGSFSCWEWSFGCCST